MPSPVPLCGPPPHPASPTWCGSTAGRGNLRVVHTLRKAPCPSGGPARIRHSPVWSSRPDEVGSRNFPIGPLPAGRDRRCPTNQATSVEGPVRRKATDEHIGPTATPSRPRVGAGAAAGDRRRPRPARLRQARPTTRGGATARRRSPSRRRRPAFDYTQVAGLTTDRYGAVKETLELPMHDGTEVHIEVTRPADANGQPVAGERPVILEASPYHGTLRPGRPRILPDPADDDGISLGLTGYFAPGLRRRDDGPARHRPLGRLPRPPRPQRRRGPQARRRVGGVPAVVQRPGRHDRQLLRRLDADGGRRQNPQGLPPSSRAPASRRCTTTSSRPARRTTRSGPDRSPPTRLPWTVDPPEGDNFGRPSPRDRPACRTTPPTGRASPGQYHVWHRARPLRARAACGDPGVHDPRRQRQRRAHYRPADWFMKRGARAGDKAWIGQWDHGSGFRADPPRHPVAVRPAGLVRQAPQEAGCGDRSVRPGVHNDGTIEGGRTGDRSQILNDSSGRLPPRTPRCTRRPTAPSARRRRRSPAR